MAQIILFYKHKISAVTKWVKNLFVTKKSLVTSKLDLNLKKISIMGSSVIAIFIALGTIMPSENSKVFSEVKKSEDTNQSTPRDTASADSKSQKSASKVWDSNGNSRLQSKSVTQVNYNTAMVMGTKNGNAKNELNAGLKIKLQIVDKFVASTDGTPVLARVAESSETANGLSIPIGALFYGEASYQKSSERALIKFKKASFPDGRIIDISAGVISSDGVAGLEGKIMSDSVKNSAGQVITSFVGGLAAGSVQRDVFGNSRGGIENGLMQAFADTAKDRTQQYGERLKEAREWIEIDSGTNCEAILLQSLNLMPQDQGGYHE